MGKLNNKNGTARGEVVEEGANMICKHSNTLYRIKCSSNKFLFCNQRVLITLNDLYWFK